MGVIDGCMAMCKHWIFTTASEGHALPMGECVYMCKAHSLIDLAVSQWNRSFSHEAACKIIDNRMDKRADGMWRAE